jgi:uncharacterized membrane protein YbhN (UPF0104 family)
LVVTEGGHNGVVHLHSRVVRAALAAGLVAGAGALLVHAFRAVDMRSVEHAIARIGPFSLLVLAPFLGAMVFDSMGMAVLLRVLGRDVPLTRLLPIRIATEALHVTAPAGFLVADAATAALLDVRCKVPATEGALLAVARKWLVMRAHAAYILLGAGLGAVVLAHASEEHLGGRWLPWVVGASAVIPLLLSVGLGTGFRGRPVVARLQALFSRLPWPALRERSLHWREGAIAVDERLARIAGARHAVWIASAAFAGCWLLESLDTLVILRLLGTPADLAFAMAAEVGVSLLRSAGNIAPAGLGVQDAGYATLFPAMGMTAESAVAFVLVKRAKELVWIVAGFALLGWLRYRESPEPILRPRRRSLSSSMISVDPRLASRPWLGTTKTPEV